MSSQREPIAVLGGGSWGTALAVILAQQSSSSVRLWMRDQAVCSQVLRERRNPAFLPGIVVPENVLPTTALATAVEGVSLVLHVIPAQATREVAGLLAQVLPAGIPLVSATKGLEQSTLRRMSQVLSETFESRAGFVPPLAVLSGPSFALEVARRDPTAVVIASADEALARRLQSQLSGPSFRLYSSTDVLGVELMAAVKNVIAIAAGICTGLGLGHNSMAALITRGLAELGRLVAQLGGRPATVTGLAGLGDLVLTCTGELSRNRFVGQELGKGRALQDILAGMRSVAEGVATTSAALQLACQHGVEMPITAQMSNVLFDRVPPREAIRPLMERSLKSE